MASSQNFFIWLCRVLIFQQGLIPRRTKSCGVSDPTEKNPAGYKTPQNEVLRSIRPCRTMTEMCKFHSRRMFCGGRYTAEQRPAGPDTPSNKTLRGIRPRGTKFCKVSNPREQLLKANIYANSKKKSKIFLGVNSRTNWCRFVEKTRGRKFCATVPILFRFFGYCF
jgi:hypothetical protein